MAPVALDPAYRRVSVKEFLAMDFGGARAELEDGLIYLMAGGNEQHARISGNVFAFFHTALRGSGCRPYGSDFATLTGGDTVRFPDVSVHCGDPGARGNERKQLLGDPVLVVEVLSPSTATHDQRVKLAEYRELAGVKVILLIDPVAERIRHVRRTGANGWADDWLETGADVLVPELDLTLPHAEIFARD